MKKYILSFLLPLLALTIAFTACSESNDEEEEFTEWQSTNDSYFDNLYAQTKAKIAAGDA